MICFIYSTFCIIIVAKRGVINENTIWYDS
nr:MAG TPA: hypothetical protein [Caudoviricetes sp.]